MIKIPFKSLRARLFAWYIGSLLLLLSFFLIFVHYYMIPNALLILIVLFVILALGEFIIIYKISKSLTYLSSRIKAISSKNLKENVSGIDGEDEIAELALSFNNLLNRLDEAFQREQQFIADVAHELKTPLATLKSSFEVTLSKKRSAKEYHEVIERSVTEIDHLSSTLKNVLDLAWSESSMEENNRTKFNLTELLEDLYDIAQKMALKKNIEVSLSAPPKMYLLGFREKLARAILNIIENGIKYSPNGGKVQIELEKVKHRIYINITDTGRGILVEEIPFIFERFYRGSKTDKVLGSGLGLAIAKSIIKLHQGDIKVSSKVGKGSTFIIILPVA